MFNIRFKSEKQSYFASNKSSEGVRVSELIYSNIILSDTILVTSFPPNNESNENEFVASWVQYSIKLSVYSTLHSVFGCESYQSLQERFKMTWNFIYQIIIQ